MPERFGRPYLDSSVYIAAIKGEQGRADVAKRILNDARNGSLQIVGSTFVIAEVLRGRSEPAPLTAEQERVIDEYVFHDYITWVEVDVSIALESRKLARRHGLKPPDAIHLASAIRGGADQLLRWDDKFRLEENEKYESVVVCEPHLVGLPEPISGFPEAPS